MDMYPEDRRAPSVDRLRREPDLERRLVAGLQVGDETAVRDLVTIFGPLVFRQARQRVVNYEDAEEITQDVLLTAVQRISGFRRQAALSSWIYRIAFNASMTRLRAGRRLKRFGRTLSLDASLENDAGGCLRRRASQVPDPGQSPEERVAREQTRLLVNRALAELSPKTREAIVLRYTRGLSMRQAGRLLRVSPKTVRSRLFRGRQVLRARLAAPRARHLHG